MKNRVKNGLRISLALLFIAVGLVSAPVGAVPIKLSDLIANQGSITVGDKLFSDFTFSLSGQAPYTPSGASGINVDGIVIGGNNGLRFSGGMHAGPGGDVDLLIGYTVTVLDPNYWISGIVLRFNGSVTADGFTNVTETVSNGVNIVGQATVVNAPPVLDQTIYLNTPFLTTVDVVKDIYLSGGQNGTATISFIDQAVIQTRVPEPTTLVLLGLGLLAFGASRRGGRA